MHLSRRHFIATCAAMGAANYALPSSHAANVGVRSFHLCTSPDPLDQEPDRLEIYSKCGLSTIWLAGFFYGYWPASIERIDGWKKRIEGAGLNVNIVNIPLGHPGDSLGASSGDFPLTPPTGWRVAIRPDGTKYVGTSLHAPATEQNCAALKELSALGVKSVFLDDDFRLAVGPGVIGGCFCDEHRAAFLARTGFTDSDWQTLLADVKARNLSSILREWVEFTCDDLTNCFRAQQAAVPNIALGNMIMYLGAEKAGIRLKDYVNAPFRVGELMFDDNSFGRVKGKTNELFSCLFHRRFAKPELAYSETTAYPADKLSAKNMAAKLAVSTIADVRNTMFMSGITPFPRAHWDVLTPAMKKHAAIHEKLAGHTPRGPMKHYWGEHSRYVGDDNPNSLFLGMGIPFEVCDVPPTEGFTCLSDADAVSLSQTGVRESGTTYVTRKASSVQSERIRSCEETPEALAALKREIVAAGGAYPYVENDSPVVCAWYPTANAVLLWNLTEERQTYSLRTGKDTRAVEVDALDVALVEIS